MNELRILAKIFYVLAYIGGIIGLMLLFTVIIAMIIGEKETVWVLFPACAVLLSSAIGCKLSQIGIEALNYIVEAARKYTNK